MRLSQTLFTSLRSVAAHHETESHRLLIRAGYLRQLGQGLFSALPLGQRSMSALETLLRKEMAAIDCQEISMPVAQPAALWQQSGRYDSIGPELARFTDRRNRPMVLALTHEEAATALCRDVVESYRQLPQAVFQIQTKFRDDARPRAGLIRVREFQMKDAYSYAADETTMLEQYARFQQAYERIFAACELPAVCVEADVGMMGGAGAHEYMYLTPIGEDTLILCSSCGYAANRQVAVTRRPEPHNADMEPIERVRTTGAATVDDLAAMLSVAPRQIAKAVMFTGGMKDGSEEFIFAVTRGDDDVNETKLANAVGALELRPATEDEIRKVGAEPGYASPVGLSGIITVVDAVAAASRNLIAGGNEPHIHLKNVNVGRDFTATVTTDIVTAGPGDSCVRCGHSVSASRGVEIANTFKLGTTYSEPIGATFRTRDGDQRPVVMGSYGIGVGRLLACIAEEHHDENGLRWPPAVAPAAVHIVPLGDAGTEPASMLYAQLQANGVTALLDDRDERAGVKLTDADLIGCPTRVVIGARSLHAGGAEVRDRSGERRTVAFADVVGALMPAAAAR